MKNIAWKVGLILFIVALCLYAVIPPSTKIRLGKDLQGGTSMIYLVKMPENTDNRQAVLGQTIQVLKERVDPRGILDISMQPLGADRIEIVMPLPNEQVLALRDGFRDELDKLTKMAEIRPSQLDQALRFGRAVEFYGGGSSERAAQIETLQRTYNEVQETRKALNEGKSGGAEGDALSKLEQAVADAEFNFETARDAILRTSLDRARITRTLNLSKDPQKQLDANGNVQLDANGKAIIGPSPREVALKALKDEFPHLSSQIDSALTAYDAYHAQRTTLDDPEDLMRLLRGAGVLEFRIAVENSNPEGVNVQQLRDQLREKGPEGTDSPVARWFPINELKQWYKTPAQLAALEANPEVFFANFGGGGLVAAKYEGQYYLLLYTRPDRAMTHDQGTPWTVESTGISIDRLGRNAVAFRLDVAGGQLMGRLTGSNIDKPMAIVLDGQVYSAPNINSQITGNGVIEGEFSQTELSYLTRVLAAGALEARLSDEPIAINTLGPSLGKDNLYKGLEACLLSLIVTAAIMMIYYFFAGVIANVALLINAIMIFGIMALIDGTFTLPGLAGVALSIAMAVDANVLIYERIREEIVNNKEDLRTAIRLGYSRAMSAIIDGNLTNLIVCVVLLYTATTEVKGFALTMMLGVIATLFSALFITRALYTFYTDAFKFTKLPMLPTVFPAIHRALTPNVNWISKRNIFIGASLIASIISIALVVSRGGQMLDTEFRGGLAMTMQTRMNESGERLMLSRPEVEQQVHAIGEAVTDPNDPVYQLRNASVLTVGESEDFKASRFQIKVGSPPGAQSEATVTDQVVEAIVNSFGDKLDIVPALSFKGENDENHGAYTRPIEDSNLGANIGRPELTQPVSDFRGGVAVLIEGLSQPVTIEDAEDRIVRLREQPDFAKARYRDSDVVGLDPVDPADPSKGFTSLAVLTYDTALDHRKVDFSLWDRDLAASEWKLVRTAMERGSSLQEISSFSPAVARTMAANAVVAIVLSLLGMLVYIWVRFGSLRYSVSAIVALAHNMIICLGALALTHYIAGTGIASALLIDEYRIDLNVIAALLTIIGYSLNDTIVILDRIRENRGKRLAVSPEIVNLSINQTFSRTILTGGSTILASIILFVLGGTGIQPFAYTFLIGLIAGTYSSVAIAAPLVVQKPQEADTPPATPVEVERLRHAGTVAGAAS